ncbi:class I SAM-dependent DNA methyltransferase [Sphingomonas montana]|uniref:class I SAM-dependent DNA methyltransferase n=1 Tax=Sphingomonas montana TaxID=1843236 RepID=UPI00096ED288|nr:SAM-dependent methyltransferase [Sphingomonas montana]
MRRETTIGADYFEQMYRDDADPWKFATSDYEAAKYDRTLAALPAGRFARVLEVGCSIGVLTQRIAPRCDALVAVDVSATALAQAAERCADLRQVTFAQMAVPDRVPDGVFDLVLLSEVVYYLDSADIVRLADYLRGAMAAGAHLLLVHWTGVTDYPKTADAATEELRAALGPAVSAVHAERHDAYRLDLWRGTERDAG